MLRHLQVKILDRHGVTCHTASLDEDFCPFLGSQPLYNIRECGCAEPDVLKAEDVPSLKWQPADEEGLVAFLVGEKNFNEDRVRKQIQKMAATKGKSAQGI